MSIPKRNFNRFGMHVHVPKENYPNLEVTTWWEQTREDCPIVWRGNTVRQLAFDIGLHNNWHPLDIYCDALHYSETYFRTGRCRIRLIGQNGHQVDVWYMDSQHGNQMYKALFNCRSADEFISKVQQILSEVKV